MNGGINTYGYVGGNPVNAIDPLGLTKKDKWYGYNDPNFRDWVHKIKQSSKRGAAQNYTKQEIKELWDRWHQLGKPRGKGGKSGRGGKARLAKKGFGAICRKIPVIAIGAFIYDSSEGGIGHATNELVWPISELWMEDETEEQCSTCSIEE